MKLLLENWREYIKEEEDVNEIFGMGKEYIDFDTDHLDAIQQIPIAINHAVRGLEHDGYPQELYKEYLEELIKEYEKEVDPMLSRLMVAKSQIDKSTRTIDPFVAKSVNHYLPDEVASWENDSDLIKQLIELILNMRNKILGAYKRHRNKVSNMPPYKPKPNMHDLENLMGKAKVREEVNEIFGLGTKKADITSDHVRQMKLLNRQIRGDFSSNRTSWYSHYTEDELLALLSPAPEDYRRGIDLAARALVAIRNIQFNDYTFSREYMKNGTKQLKTYKAALELRSKVIGLIDSLEFMRKIYAKLIEDYDLHHSDHPIQREIPKDQSLEDLQKLMTGMYVSPESRLEEG